MIHPQAQIGEDTKLWHEALSNIGNCKIGHGCTIHSHVWIGDGVVIGNYVRIEAFTFIPPGVTIADGAFIGPRVTFTNDRRPPAPSPEGWEKTTVRPFAVIGAGAILLPGITIGEGATVGAGAVVLHDVSPNSTVVGNPAHTI
jgi:UDP-2-acetamido-3-amino-2,3-dideoxy-glucuronate N-acetyltransferase